MRMATAYARKLRPSLSKHARSGTMSGVTGGLSVLRGIREIRRGKRFRGLARILTGLVLVGVAVTQRRNARGRGDVDQSDVVSTGPDDLEAAATDDDAGVEHREDVDDAVDTGADIDDIDPDERGEDLGEGDVDEREVVDTGTDAVDATEESGEAGTEAENEGEASDDGQTEASRDEAETVGDDVDVEADDGEGGENDR